MIVVFVQAVSQVTMQTQIKIVQAPVLMMKVMGQLLMIVVYVVVKMLI